MRDKTNKNYWKGVGSKTKPLRKRPLGKGRVSPDFQALVQFTDLTGRKERRWFATGKSGIDAAAHVMTENFKTLQNEGWAAFDFIPDEIDTSNLKVGEFLNMIKGVSRIGATTWGNYEQGFCQIAGEINGIESIPNAGKGKMQKIKMWKEQVRSLPLSSITRYSAAAWMKNYVDRRNGGPDEKRAAKTSANSTLAKAKPLFNPERLELIGLEGLENPFERVKPYPKASRRYVSKFNVVDLILDAERDLAGPQVNGEKVETYEKRNGAFRTLILCGFTGIRRKDADLLLWEQIDLEKGKGLIDIRRTKYFEPKSESTLREIALDQDAIIYLKAFREETPKDEFFLPGVAPRLDTSYRHYRSNRFQKHLMVWLREYEHNGGSPLRALTSRYIRSEKR